jgi:hypothetical protein
MCPPHRRSLTVCYLQDEFSFDIVKQEKASIDDRLEVFGKLRGLLHDCNLETVFSQLPSCDEQLSYLVAALKASQELGDGATGPRREVCAIDWSALSHDPTKLRT